LVKGASTGEALGNKFLSQIRNVDAIVHVVRCFENKDIESIDNRIKSVEKLTKSGDNDGDLIYFKFNV